jgi:hypothetical protein
VVRLHGQGASRASLAAGLPLVQGRLTLELAQRAAARAGMVIRLTRVALAEDNYVQHKVASSQIGSRVRAGVGRGVDLEQSNARLALAESNLVTETANLHDVTARYARIVGELPPARVAKAAPSNAGLPASAADAGNAAVQASPAISAAIESLRAARASAKGREGSAWQPRVEARLRSGTGRHLDGIADQRRDTSAEVVLEWNLYNGGSDRARIRQAADIVNQAADLRDKACRDTRQGAAIAFNDTRKFAEQLESLDRNVLAIEKARDAYRQQFDIGQRSLLDLLNAENELFTARRAYANAQADLLLAQARTLATTQRLTTQLGLTRMEDSGMDTPTSANSGRRWRDALPGAGLRPVDCNPQRTRRPRGTHRAAGADAAPVRRDGYLRCGGRSVHEPCATSAAMPMLSPSVGCGWIVLPMSTASAPISMASATSPIMSPAWVPTMPPPTMRWLSSSNSSLVKPSSRPLAIARPDAVHGNRPFLTFCPLAFASSSVRPTHATSGSV